MKHINVTLYAPWKQLELQGTKACTRVWKIGIDILLKSRDGKFPKQIIISSTKWIDGVRTIENSFKEIVNDWMCLSVSWFKKIAADIKASSAHTT